MSEKEKKDIFVRSGRNKEEEEKTKLQMEGWNERF